MPLCSITTRPSIGCSGEAGVTPGKRGHRVDLVPDLAFGHPGPPLIAWLEHDIGFDHRGWGRIECRFDATDLSQHIRDFGDLLDHCILGLQHFHRLVKLAAGYRLGM